MANYSEAARQTKSDSSISIFDSPDWQVFEKYPRIAILNRYPELKKKVALWYLEGKSQHIPLLSPRRFLKKTNILFLGSGGRPDDLKDLMALKEIAGSMNVTYAYAAASYKKIAPFYRVADQVVDWKSGCQLAQLILRLKPEKLIIGRKGSIEAMVIASLLHEGRLIFRANEFSTRAPFDILEKANIDIEAYLFEVSDACFHIYDEDVKDYLSLDFVLPKQFEMIRPQCLPQLAPKKTEPKLRKKDGDWHIAYIASFLPLSQKNDFAAHAVQYDYWKDICTQGVHVHAHDYSGRVKQQPEEYKEYLELEKQSPYFHIEKRLPYKRLIDNLTRFDWGMPYFNLSTGLKLREGFETAVGNNFFSQLQAGLPLIVHPTSRGMASLVKRLGIGLVLDELELKSIRHILNEIDYGRLIGNVTKETSEGELQYSLQKLKKIVLGDICG